MFIALEVTRRESQGILNALRGILSRPKTVMEHRELLGIPYGLIQAEAGRDGPDWDAIEELATQLPRPLLLPEGIRPPDGTRLRLFQPKEFDSVVLLRTACRLIDRSRMPMYRRVLGLLDWDGLHCSMLDQLLKHFTTVRVVTGNLSRYQDAADRLLYQLGAPVLVSDQLSSLCDCVLVLSPGPFENGEDFRLPCPVLCSEPPSLRYKADVFHSLRAGLPAGCEPLPAGLCSHLAMAALYELEGVRDLEYAANNFLYNGKHSSLQEAVRFVLMMAGYSYAELQDA